MFRCPSNVPLIIKRARRHGGCAYPMDRRCVSGVEGRPKFVYRSRRKFFLNCPLRFAYWYTGKPSPDDNRRPAAWCHSLASTFEGKPMTPTMSSYDTIRFNLAYKHTVVLGRLEKQDIWIWEECNVVTNLRSSPYREELAHDLAQQTKLTNKLERAAKPLSGLGNTVCSRRQKSLTIPYPSAPIQRPFMASASPMPARGQPTRKTLPTLANTGVSPLSRGRHPW
jgi:hypothetical protein